MDATFLVAISIFILFIALVLVSTINYFTRTPESATIIELREKTKNLFDIFFGRGGIITSERLTTDLYRIPILLEEKAGIDRTNEVVSFNVEFDDLCDIVTTWNNTIRVYDQQFNELPSKISYQEFCSSQYLNNSYITFFVNISANQKKRVYIYWINNTETIAPKHNLTIRGYWKFDDGSGTLAKDSSGWENNGTLHNGTDICANGDCPTWTTGIYGGAIQLDGVNDYVEVADSESINVTGYELTLSAWVKLNSTIGSDSTGMIISKTKGTNNEQYALLYTTNSHSMPNRFRFDVRTSNGLASVYTSSTYTSTNRWYHVAGVYNTTHLIIYVDGIESNATSQSGAIVGQAADVNIGRSSAGGQYFNGTIDDVRIYNKSLTASQIAALALTSNQPLDLKTFPSETITAISAQKVRSLTDRDYQELKRALGENFDFRIEIREKK